VALERAAAIDERQLSRVGDVIARIHLVAGQRRRQADDRLALIDDDRRRRCGGGGRRQRFVLEPPQAAGRAPHTAASSAMYLIMRSPRRRRRRGRTPRVLCRQMRQSANAGETEASVPIEKAFTIRATPEEIYAALERDLADASAHAGRRSGCGASRRLLELRVTIGNIRAGLRTG
jgi:hypothetical protein